jgi:hypothetical protein
LNTTIIRFKDAVSSTATESKEGLPFVLPSIVVLAAITFSLVKVIVTGLEPQLK